MEIFGIKSSLDLFNKLELDYNEFKKECLSSRHAINCAFTAWHLTDWTFKDQHKFSSKGLFRDSLQCPSLKIMHDITTGVKHCEITKPKANIESTGERQGDFCNEDFDNEDFDVSVLTLIMADGSEKVFIDELEIVVSFWREYFKR